MKKRSYFTQSCVTSFVTKPWEEWERGTKRFQCSFFFLAALPQINFHSAVGQRNLRLNDVGYLEHTCIWYNCGLSDARKCDLNPKNHFALLCRFFLTNWIESTDSKATVRYRAAKEWINISLSEMQKQFILFCYFKFFNKILLKGELQCNSYLKTHGRFGLTLVLSRITNIKKC